MPVSQLHPQNILVAKLCCIGDVVYMTPMLRAIKKAYPQSTIFYLAVPWVKDVVAQLSHVDETILYEAPLSDKSTIAKGIESISLIAKLRKSKIDTMLIGHRNKIFALLGKLSGIPVRVGLADAQNPYLTHPVPFQPEQFEISRYLDLLQPLGIEIDGTRTEMKPFPDEQERVQAQLQKYGITAGEPVLGLFPGGGENPGTHMPIKRWTPESYIRLCQLLLVERKEKIILIGGPNDSSLNDSIIDAVGCQPGRIVNVARDCSLRAIPALMQRFALVVGGDTGPMHIASAVGTPTLFLFGPTHPAIHAPRNTNSTYLWKHIDCSPCHTPVIAVQKKYFDGKKFHCWKGTIECMKMISVEEVNQAINTILHT